MLAQTFGKPAVSTARYGTRTLWGSFSAGPGKICCRNKRQQKEPPVGLEAGSQLKSQGKWLGVGGTFLWDFTYLCWANPINRFGKITRRRPHSRADHTLR